MRQAHVDEGVQRELPLAALDLLQAEYVRRLLLDEAGDLLGAQADGIDVPGAEAKAHGGDYRVAGHKAPGRRDAGRA